MSLSSQPVSYKYLIRQGIISWAQASPLIAVIYTLMLGYASLMTNLKDYILLFLYIAIIGILLGIILGALCAVAIGLIYKILGRDILPPRIGSLCHSVLFFLIAIILLYRKYAFNLSFSQYPFIKSYKGMIIFVSLRMIAFIIGSIITAYFLYRIFLFFKKAFLCTRQRIIIAQVAYGLVLLVILFAFAATFNSKAKEITKLKPPDRAQFNINTEKHVFLIGADGASWDVINTLISKGALPNIRKLMHCGSYAPLKTLKPCLSPMVWTSIDTGKVPQKHGIVGFYRFSIPGITAFISPYETIGADFAGRLIERIGIPLNIIYNHYGMRRAEPIWQILSERGVEVGVINWYYSWPPPEVNGFILSDRFPYFILQEPFAEDKILQALMINSQEHQVASVYPLHEIYQYIKEYLQENTPHEANQRLVKMKEMGVEDYLDFSSFPFFYYLLEHYKPAFLAFYFTEPDISQHLFWNYWQPQFFSAIADEEMDANKDRIPSIYKKVDEAVGRIWETAGEDAVIIVVSDHGFSAYFNSPNPGGHAHSPDGVFIISGKGIKKHAMLSNPSVLDIAPTILYLYNLPVARDMDGKVLTELFDAQYLKKHLIAHISSYGAPESDYDRIKQNISKEQLKKLKALGYIQ